MAMDPLVPLFLLALGVGMALGWFGIPFLFGRLIP